jgi:hypothetical protein
MKIKNLILAQDPSSEKLQDTLHIKRSTCSLCQLCFAYRNTRTSAQKKIISKISSGYQHHMLNERQSLQHDLT